MNANLPGKAVLATMHGKERVIAPVLGRFLQMEVETIIGLDTDRFGTFTREVPRIGSAVDTARAKIAAAFELRPDARIGLASEGSFGPHPFLPFVPCGSELVMLVDRDRGLELQGHFTDSRPNFVQLAVTATSEAMAFAAQRGFPEQGIIVMGCVEDQPAPERGLFKAIGDWAELEKVLGSLIGRDSSAFLETDMRAHRNPRPRRAIRRATLDLVRASCSLCPSCGRPGFVITDLVPGVPCSWCGEPTDEIKARVFSCSGCGHREERATGVSEASPGQCARCNP